MVDYRNTFFFLEEEPTRLHIASDSGKERWISKSRLISYRVRGDDVDIVAPAHRGKEFKDMEAVTHTMRRCLCCRETFLAEGANRVCTPCKAKPFWHSSSPFENE